MASTLVLTKKKHKCRVGEEEEEAATANTNRVRKKVSQEEKASTGRLAGK